MDLSSPGEPATKHLFVSAPCWIGTSLECQIPLAGTGISDRHACITLESGHYRLRPVPGAKVMVNERLVEDHTLGEGDAIFIGKHAMRVRWMLDGPRFDATDEWEKSFLVINVPGRPPEHFPLGRRDAKVGRAPTCDLVLPVPQILPHHATLSWQEEGLVIEKGAGPGLIKVNGEFTRFRALSHGDEILIGPVTLTLVSRRRVFKTMEFLTYDPYGPQPGSRDTRHDESDAGEEAPVEAPTPAPEAPGPRAQNPLRFLDDAWVEEAPAPVAAPPPQPAPPRPQQLPFLAEVLRHDGSVLRLAGFERFKVHVSRLARNFSSSGARGRLPYRGLLLLGPRGAGRKHAMRALAYMLGLRAVRFQWEKLVELPP